MTLKQKQKRLATLWDDLRHEVSSSTMDIIDEIVKLELQIEAECNK